MLDWMELRVVCASWERVISLAAEEGLSFRNIRCIDSLTIVFWVPAKDREAITKLFNKHGGQVIIVAHKAFGEALKDVWKQPIMIFTIFILLCLTIYLPTRVLFVCVDGISGQREKEVVDLAANCGLHFGAAARNIRSEEIKNSLLAALPEFTWVGVNIDGCVATISLRERMPAPAAASGICDNIVASKDGVIRELVVMNGTAVCSVGDYVIKGQQIISGYETFDDKLRFVGAQAEVYAKTMRNLTVVTPNIWQVQAERTGMGVRYSLIIGKKLINLYNSCGISMGSCDRISKRYPLVLPGGFELPVCILQERTLDYNITDYHSQDTSEFAWMIDNAEGYLENVGMLGYIENKIYDELSLTDVATYCGEYFCVEMIAQKSEALILNNEQRS